MIDTTHRSKEVEIMDDFEMTGDMLTKTLRQIAKINHLLGGNAVTINGLKKLLTKQPKSKPITVLDVGCGNGDMLRIVANLGKKLGYNFVLIGVDANLHTIENARSLSTEYTNISYIQQDILSSEFKELSYDVVLCTLFLHHFTNDEIDKLLSLFLQKATLGIIVNDLHRHKLAYYLFKLISLTIHNPMVKNDGLISILRGFKKQELELFSKKLKARNSIQWKWAFRYQWIIRKN